MRTVEWKGRTFHILENGEPSALLFWIMGEHEKNMISSVYENIQRLSGKKDWWLIACEIKDWNGELSPWAAPAVFGNSDFAGEGRKTLEWIVELCDEFFGRNSEMDEVVKVIGGYSLAGLFALWAYYETGIFKGVASCSGSLWFPRWEEYVQSHEVPDNSLVYLSLGKREEKTKNPVMARIGDVTREIYEKYKTDEQILSAILEWNEGNHFTDTDVRMAKGFAWILSKLK